MGFLDKAKSAAEQAATKAREGVEDVQSKRNLAHAYEQLGETAFELIEAGDISHERLAATAEQIRELKAGSPATSATEATAPPATPA